MTAQSNQITGEDLRFAEGQMKLFQIFHRVLEKHFSDLGNPDMVDPLSGQNFNASLILRGLALHRDELERDFADMKDTLKVSSEPPSLGTVVRSLRETGEVDMSYVLAEDSWLTSRIMRYPQPGPDVLAAGEAAALSGGRPEDNPYDLMDDSQAMSHLTWNDGFSSVELENGSEMSSLMPVSRATIDAQILTIVRLQIELMNSDVEPIEKVLVLEPFPSDSKLAGSYLLCNWVPAGDGVGCVTEPYKPEEVGFVPNTVVQAMQSRGHLERYESSRLFGISEKALRDIGPQLGYEVVLPEDDTPDLGT